MSESATLFWLRLTEWGLLVSGAVLVVGLVGEYKLPSWHWRLRFFELLVLIGCGGELLSDAGLFWSSEHLQRIEHSRVVTLGELANGADEKARKAALDADGAISKAAEAKTVANGATITAGQAEIKAGTAKEAAGQASVKADKAKTAAGVARQEAKSAENEVAEVGEQAAKAAADLAQERKRRLEMERAISPRLLPIISSRGKSNLDSLKMFKGTDIEMEVVPDPEAERTAAALGNFLENAGWKVLSIKRTGTARDGVEIESYHPDDSMLNKDFDAVIRSEECAQWLAAYLKRYDWEAQSRVGQAGTVPRNALKITVGLKPVTYFSILRPAPDVEGEKLEAENTARIKAKYHLPDDLDPGDLPEQAKKFFLPREKP
jgi:hypothetical protein